MVYCNGSCRPRVELRVGDGVQLARIMNLSISMPATREAALARERLRRLYRPARVRLLFVGEAPPASGRFFYLADSGLYRAIRDAFLDALPTITKEAFLDSFQELGCYLVDLCGMPVDRLSPEARRQACFEGEIRLARSFRDLRPEIVITVVRSIGPHVRSSQQKANWTGVHIELPYPGRWYRHRDAFLRALTPVLRERFSSPISNLPGSTNAIEFATERSHS